MGGNELLTGSLRTALIGLRHRVSSSFWSCAAFPRHPLTTHGCPHRRCCGCWCCCPHYDEDSACESRFRFLDDRITGTAAAAVVAETMAAGTAAVAGTGMGGGCAERLPGVAQVPDSGCKADAEYTVAAGTGTGSGCIDRRDGA